MVVLVHNIIRETDEILEIALSLDSGRRKVTDPLSEKESSLFM